MENITELENHYIVKNNKRLRLGYTTGSCAAAAAKAATIMLLQSKDVKMIDLMTPKGIRLHLQIKDIKRTKAFASCAIQKDAGDDPDVTDKALVYAKVYRREKGDIVIEGGKGIGRVTKRGLEQPIGAAAINKVPRQMIRQEVAEICDQNDYKNGIYVEISIPRGEELAKKTFNPRLGIEGGISVLGTTGIVEPMSEAALIASIRIEMNMLHQNGFDYLLMTPGNYGQHFSMNDMKLDLSNSMKCSNYIGDTIDMAVEIGITGMLIVSHIGKLIKVAAGIMNTHSRNADGRAEILAAHTILCGGSANIAKEILACITTEEALHVLSRVNLLSTVMESVMSKVEFYLNNRSYQAVKVGAVMFSNIYGELGRTTNVKDLLEHMKK